MKRFLVYMHFIHQSYQPGETIAAIATPPGEGGVAIVRISGEQALDVAERVFSGPIRSFSSHTAHYGQVRNALGEHVDDVLALVMLGKRSYTGEDTVEIHCHGGSLITRRVLEVILHAGARPARPESLPLKPISMANSIWHKPKLSRSSFALKMTARSMRQKLTSKELFQIKSIVFSSV